MLLATYTSILTASVFLRRAQYNTQAAAFIQEELDSLRALPFASLVNRANGRFLGLSMTRGQWQVKTVTSPPSGTKALELGNAQTAIVGETGLLVLPGNYTGNATVSAKVKVLSTSPAGWGAGIALRYLDAENHYRFRFSSGGIAFDKVKNGAVTTLWSQSATYSTNTWYALEAVMSAGQFTLKRNGATITTVTDADFVTGDAALIALSGALAQADDVAVTEAAATTWNFDADAVGILPKTWQRMSVFDLPAGSGTLTIEDHLGVPDIKKTTVTVSWNDGGATRSMSGSTLIVQK